MRDRVKVKNTNLIEHSTYAIPTTLEAFDYYENIKNDLEKVFLSLLEVHVQSMQNRGQPFLMPDVYCVPQQDKPKWLGIAKRVNFFTGSTPNLNLVINVRQRSISSMLNAICRDHIFRFNEDILKSMSNVSLKNVPANPNGKNP